MSKKPKPDVPQEPATKSATEPPVSPETQPETPAEVIPKVALEIPEEESLKNRLLRLQADFDNFRKRTQRERSELFLFANEALFLEMLPILDHFEMGFKSAEEHETDCSVTAGFRMVYNQLLELLKKFNVTVLDGVGEPLDPHRHEAILYRPSSQPAETVIEQVRRGYMLGGKLLRAAQVIVSSGAEENGIKE